MSARNQPHFRDNLDVLEGCVDDESVALVYLDPPFNSNANDNVLFNENDGARAGSRVQAFENTRPRDPGAVKCT